MVVAGQVHEAYAAYISPEMRHHNIYFPGDAAGIEQAVADDYRVHPRKRLAVKMVLEEGDRVMVYSHRVNRRTLHGRRRISEQFPAAKGPGPLLSK